VHPANRKPFGVRKSNGTEEACEQDAKRHAFFRGIDACGIA
jgi:hypothetical protein